MERLIISCTGLLKMHIRIQCSSYVEDFIPAPTNSCITKCMSFEDVQLNGSKKNETKTTLHRLCIKSPPRPLRTKTRQDRRRTQQNDDMVEALCCRTIKAHLPTWEAVVPHIVQILSRIQNFVTAFILDTRSGWHLWNGWWYEMREWMTGWRSCERCFIQ